MSKNKINNSIYIFSLGTQTFSTVSARIWNAVIVKFND